MARCLLAAALLTALLVASISRAASVSVSLMADVAAPVPAGSTLPYEIHITINDAGGSPKTQGLCMFVVNLQSDLAVEQAPVQAFAREIAAGFDAIPLQFGVPDGSGGVSNIAAAQPCFVADDTVLGLGLYGRTLVAQGELFTPPTTGNFTVRIIPLQMSLIAPEGDRAIDPDSVSGGSLSITVGPAGAGDDGDTDTDGLGGDDGDAGTDGLGEGDTGTDGLGNGNVGTNGGPDGGDGDAGTDGLDDGDDNSNSSAGSDLGMVGGGSATPASPTLGLCGAGLLGSIFTGLIAANAFRASRARPRPRP